MYQFFIHSFIYMSNPKCVITSSNNQTSWKWSKEIHQ